MFCTNCGSKLEDDAKFCVMCGKKAEIDDEIEKDTYCRNKCRFLREIRKSIARMNKVDVWFMECTHEGPCSGTCPACDREIAELNMKLEEKIRRGEEVFLPDVTVDHKEIIPSHLRDVQEWEKDKNDWRNNTIDIPLAGVSMPANEGWGKKIRFPWSK